MVMHPQSQEQLQPKKRARRPFPRKLGRFINLEGGLYGTLDLVAITDELLELQTGEDFIRFDREQAKNLRDTIDKFLAFEKDKDGDDDDDGPIIIEQAVIERPRRARARKQA
jgi:hypothetical protein